MDASLHPAVHAGHCQCLPTKYDVMQHVTCKTHAAQHEGIMPLLYFVQEYLMPTEVQECISVWAKKPCDAGLHPNPRETEGLLKSSRPQHMVTGAHRITPVTNRRHFYKAPLGYVQYPW